jgi:TfoX/Sxy family transcriptional regulator of competence genes
MAYDEKLERRIAAALEHEGTAFEQKHMFGGVAFMVRGHMAVGIVKEDLMVRVGPEGHDASLGEAHTRPMDFAGRPMKGMIYVSPDGTKSDESLARWISVATSYAKTQPIKEKKPKKKAAKKKAAKR